MAHRIAFLGLGVMGYPMAGHLSRAGYDVVVYNRTGAKAERWCDEYAGRHASTPAEAVANAQIVFACVGNDADIDAVACGPAGALAAMSPDSIFVDHTTTSARMARQLDAAATAKGVGFVDAPVSGGEAGAQNGKLTIMAGGTAADCARVEPVAAAYSHRWRRMGSAGTGQLTKMVNQICIAGLLQALSEGVYFAEAAGLDTDAVFDVIGGGAAQSWQMDNRAKTMAAREFDFGFAVEWMRKDLGFALEEARALGAQLPVTEIVDRYYAEVVANGGSRWDTSSLIARLGGGERDCSE
ncbi:MAG: NAD(P)-dependent oxidoreductase [Pseudomonadota bacterium]